jgi:hypothetical protein
MEVGLPVLTRLYKSFGSLAKAVIDALHQSLAIHPWYGLVKMFGYALPW